MASKSVESSEAKISSLAIAAMVLGILSIFTLFPAGILLIVFALTGFANIGRILSASALCLIAIPAVIFGIAGLIKIGTSAGRLKGQRFAIAGLAAPAAVLPVFCIMLVLLPAVAKLLQPRARRALPSSATDIHVCKPSIFWVHPDFWYLLKAKITLEEFETYRKHLKFVPITEDAKKEIHWTGWDALVDEWWDPLTTSDGAFYDPSTQGSHRATMKYENGYLYYMETAGI